jgi:hypothetical protein
VCVCAFTSQSYLLCRKVACVCVCVCVFTFSPTTFLSTNTRTDLPLPVPRHADFSQFNVVGEPLFEGLGDEGELVALVGCLPKTLER